MIALLYKKNTLYPKNVQKSTFFSLESLMLLITMIGCHSIYAKTWDFSAEALYLQPDLDAINIRGRSLPSNNTVHYENYNPSYNWGYQFIGTYHFTEKNDLSLNGLHFDKTYSKTFGHIIGNEATEINDLGSSIHPNLTIINLEYGQTFNPWTSHIRLFGGLQYVNFSTNEQSHVQIIAGSIDSRKNVKRGYQGEGVRFGANLAQEFQYHLGVEGSAAMALLTGTQHSNISFSPNSISTRLLSSTTVVPELEAKLGLTYTTVFQKNSLIWNVGWMWIHYFNGSLYDNYNLPLDISISQPSLSLSLQGLYFGFRYLQESYTS